MSASQDVDLSNCLWCDGAEPEHELPLADTPVHLCAGCWADRHASGLVEDLLQAGWYTPRTVAEYQAKFYDATLATEPTTESIRIVLEEIPRMTVPRRGRAADLEAFAGLGDDEPLRFDVGQFPDDVDGDDHLIAAALFAPIDTEIPVYIGGFVAAESIEAFDKQLLAMFDDSEVADGDSHA